MGYYNTLFIFLSRNNSIGKEGVEYLGNALKELKNLTSLNLDIRYLKYLIFCLVYKIYTNNKLF